MSQSSDIKAVVRPIIFREYITECLDAFPASIINENMSQFHFILGFATDTYLQDGTGTGNFTRTWNVDDFSPTKVLNLKQEHRNVKVVISIGGHGPEDVFNPYDKEEWIKNAKSSIKDLLLDYKVESTPVNIYTIDGIDINYEIIKSNEDDFAYCIGKVIKQLKEDPQVLNSVNVVSIAPTEDLQPHYRTLYLENQDNIDWINYKFYNQSFDSENEFVKLFKILLFQYRTPCKLLPGVSTNTSSPSPMTTDIFVKGCTILLKTVSLPGVFVWDANTSAPAYSLEGELQDLLTKQ
ncbi:chitinase 2-like [Lathyrus oleraceus]|uniref:chitinase 2-like n=1 Tax=Pisum sativum TaxID=3888 RepID=UPI001FC456CC|nr:chitinase 2-like [Pisum sativum]XP_050901168.1 chitinase 2-like [Pisum sativum]